ncbi:MAG: PHP domain-containing protein [Candidatus Abyssobacteria bacterium SURF_5]|uniref:PHP domain-containing protein n=1 Tax=Abyssobacteria bacterium (strain SURF_5) TaxID=2093360 RepID=A0A3A4NZF0_ABYX5|nr:MAG: PHP domain-containing protein [Candidatus Abyssubacteria bacterium SURF_5]
MLDREYIGNLHIHSTYSDGTSTIEEIAAAAGRAGIHFVGINDHFTLRGLKEGKEGWRDRVAVLVGCEINERYNHYLAYNIKDEIPNDTAEPQNVIDAVNREGGFGFIAHPYELGSPLHDGGAAFNWLRWDVNGYTGISIWNFSSIWKGNARNYPLGLYYYYNIGAADLDPLRDAMAKWDELLQTRKVVAIGTSDNHGMNVKALLGLIRGKIFDYEYACRAVNTHILLNGELPEDFQAAKQAIYDALRHGHCFVGNSLFENARGFRFYAEPKSGITEMGDDGSLADSPVLVVKSPARAHIRFIHSGRIVKEELSTSSSFKPDSPGPYRVELHLPRPRGKTRAWIYSNPIYLA